MVVSTSCLKHKIIKGNFQPLGPRQKHCCVSCSPLNYTSSTPKGRVYVLSGIEISIVMYVVVVVFVVRDKALGALKNAIGENEEKYVWPLYLRAI